MYLFCAKYYHFNYNSCQKEVAKINYWDQISLFPPKKKNQSFLVPNLLNNQSDFFKVLWRHYFDQDKLDSKHFFKNDRQNPFLNFNKLIWTNQWVVAIVVQTKTKIKVWEDLSQVTKTELQKPTKSDFFFIISESY